MSRYAPLWYVMSCRACAARVNTLDLGSLGAQLNAHASVCQYEPEVVITDANDAGDSGVDLLSDKTESLKCPRFSHSG